MSDDLHTLDVLVAWVEEEPGGRGLQVIHNGVTHLFESRDQVRAWAATVTEPIVEIDVMPMERAP